VEEEVIQSAPIAVGAAVVTEAGALDAQFLIHVPTVDAEGDKIGVENIRRATRAGLLAATHYKMERIAIPGFGYGEVGVPYDEAARAIIDEVRAYRGNHPEMIALIDEDEIMLAAFKQELGES
jgi:O-acetyl-ADP-ribose deacetylase (regulator of RNase III)